ncbi:MAG: alpha/beta hydrolase fold protein [Proteobacteria bacterium]|nr:alpha/beta hydrolase fold protein [Pseudomonadota bacterium]
MAYSGQLREGSLDSSREEYREGKVLCAHPGGLHRVAYTEWGNPNNSKVVICVHGFTRTGRDFDYLARTLAGRYRVICPDIVGRGKSEWLDDKMAYGVPQFLADMITLIARLNVEEVHWVGTSLGGMIGMFLASLEKSPISRLVLNDVGPRIVGDAIRGMRDYIGTAPDFATFDEVEAYSRPLMRSLGEHSEEEWRFLVEHLVRQRPEDGRWEFVYDPGLAEPFRQAPDFPSVDLWPIFEKIRCPTLAIRGAESIYLPRDDWRMMSVRGPKARLVEIQGVGHAPTLISNYQTGLVKNFLLEA